MYSYNCSIVRRLLWRRRMGLERLLFCFPQLYNVMQHRNLCAFTFSQSHRYTGIGRVTGACSRRPNCILYCTPVYRPTYIHIIRIIDYYIVGQRFATDSLFYRKCKTGLRNIFAPAALCTSI